MGKVVQLFSKRGPIETGIGQDAKKLRDMSEKVRNPESPAVPEVANDGRDALVESLEARFTDVQHLDLTLRRLAAATPEISIQLSKLPDEAPELYRALLSIRRSNSLLFDEAQKKELFRHVPNMKGAIEDFIYTCREMRKHLSSAGALGELVGVNLDHYIKMLHNLNPNDLRAHIVQGNRDYLYFINLQICRLDDFLSGPAGMSESTTAVEEFDQHLSGLEPYIRRTRIALTREPLVRSKFEHLVNRVLEITRDVTSPAFDGLDEATQDQQEMRCRALYMLLDLAIRETLFQEKNGDILDAFWEEDIRSRTTLQLTSRVNPYNSMPSSIMRSSSNTAWEASCTHTMDGMETAALAQTACLSSIATYAVNSGMVNMVSIV